MLDDLIKLTELEHHQISSAAVSKQGDESKSVDVARTFRLKVQELLRYQGRVEAICKRTFDEVSSYLCRLLCYFLQGSTNSPDMSSIPSISLSQYPEAVQTALRSTVVSFPVVHSEAASHSSNYHKAVSWNFNTENLTLEQALLAIGKR